MHTTQDFSLDEWERLGLPSECEGGKVIENRITGKSRWHTRHTVVFHLDDQPHGYAWEVRYKLPATECQEGQDDDPASYKAHLVMATEKTVTVYERVAASIPA